MVTDVLYDMNVKTFKKLIEKLPDDALVLVEGGHGSVVVANVMTGNCKEPNDMGFTNFMEDGSYEYEAVYFYKPM